VLTPFELQDGKGIGRRERLPKLDLVQERHAGHGTALGLGIQMNRMPEGQRNGRVIAVTHAAARKDAHVAAHHLPAPASRFRVGPQQPAVFPLGSTVWMLGADVDRLAAVAEEFLHEVGLAPPPAQRLVAENKFFVHHKPRSRHEEPFALTAKVAEGVGNAPTSADADPVFETGAVSFYLPAFQKWSGWQDSHLRPPG
jgi:hypothetical protein